MNKRFRLAQDIWIEHAAQISSVFGLSDGMARILALLYMSPEPVSIPAICERLGLTKGTVSLYLRSLEQRGIILRAFSKRQGKQKFYEMNPRAWSDVLNDFRTKAVKKFEITEDAIEKSMQALRKGQDGDRGNDRLVSQLLMERLERAREMNAIAQALLDRVVTARSGATKDSAPPIKIEVAGE